MKKLGIVLSVLMFGTVCFAQNVGIIMSVKHPLYNACANGYKKGVGAAQVKMYTAEDADVKKMMSTDPDQIVAIGAKALEVAIAERTGNTPIIYTMISEASVPTAPNTTGVVIDVTADKKVALLGRALPAVKKLGVISTAKYVTYAKQLASAAKAKGYQVSMQQINSSDELSGALDAMLPTIDCFVMVPDPSIYLSSTIKFVLLNGIKHKVPIFGLSKTYARAGAVLSLDPDYTDIGVQAGEIGKRVLGGASPGSIKFQYPRKTTHSVNKTVAGKIGVTIPADVISDAKETY